jgi:hypothetical protein
VIRETAAKSYGQQETFYRRSGLETVRNPVVELEALVTPFESGLGCTLDVLRVGSHAGGVPLVQQRPERSALQIPLDSSVRPRPRLP